MSALISQLPPGVLRAGEGEQYGVLGTTIIFKSLSHETNGAVFMWETLTPNGALTPPHIHQVEDEYIYLVEGQLEVTIGKKSYTVQPGDLVKMPRGIPHAVRSTGSGLTKALWTVAPAGKMEKFFQALAALPADQPPDPEKIVQIFVEHDIVPLPPEAQP
jgi:quercetin dioxygenase-like cupin family protein